MIKHLRTAIMIGIVASLAMPFVYTPATTFPFVFGKGVFFAVLVEILALLTVLLWTVSPEDRPHRSLLLWTTVGYFAALTVSTITGVDPDRSFWGNHERMSGLFTLLHFLALFLIARSVLRTKRQWHAVIALFLLSSLVMAGIALVEHFSPSGLFANKPAGRVWATLGNFIYLGVYMTFAIFLAGYLLTESRRWTARVALVAVMLLDLYVLSLTEGRAAMLAMVVSALVAAFLVAWQAKGTARRAAVAGIALLFIAGVGLFLARETDAVKSIPGLGRLLDTSFTAGGDRTRIIAWEIAVEAWKAKPLFGWGPENFYSAFNLFYKPESLLYSYYETWFDRAHNSVLDALSMTGTVGFLLYTGVYAAAIAAIVRKVRRRVFTQLQGALFLLLLGAYFLENLFAFDALSGFLLFYLTLAFLDARYDAAARAGAGEIAVGAAARRPSVLALVAVGVPAAFLVLWLVSVNLNIWRANAEGLLSIASLRSGRFAEAKTLHDRALARRSPHANQIRADFAREAGGIVGRVPQGMEEQALTLVQTAVDDLRVNVREDKDVFDSILLAQILTMFGPADPRFLQEAERVILDAVPLSPKRQQLHYTLARIYIAADRNDDAVRVLEQAMRDEPRLGEAHMLLALSLMDAGRPEDAWRELQEAMRLKYNWKSNDEMRFAVELGTKYGVPGDPQALAVYAHVEARLGATSTARYHMQQALERDPSLGDYQLDLERIIAEQEGALAR